MKNKKQWLAALLNFVVNGLGYLYLGKRKIFGSLVLLSTISWIIWGNQGGMSFSILIQNIWSFLGLFLVSLAFAIDAYNEGRN